MKRDDLKTNAEKALISTISECLNSLSAGEMPIDSLTIYHQLLNSGFLSITPPEEKENLAFTPPKGNLALYCIRIRHLGSYGNGRSIKPGNIRLNIKELVSIIPSIVEMAITIAIDMPVLQICAALNLWKSLRKVFTVQITREQAFVIVALWKNCDQNHTVAFEDGLIAVNALLEKYGEAPITNTKYKYILDDLEKIKCIKMDKGVIWLREWISRSYIEKI